MPDTTQAQTAPAAPPQTAPATAPAASPGPATGAPATTPATQAPNAPQTIDPKIAKAFAAMQKREASFTEERRKFDVERKALQAKAAEIEKLKATFDNAGKDPEAALKAVGMTYDQLVEWKLTHENPTPETKTKSEIAEAKELAQKNAQALEEFKQAQSDKEEARTKAERQQAQREVEESRGRFYTSAIAFIRKNVADYQLTDLNEAHAEVPKLIELVFNKTAKYDKAGNLVEPGRQLSVKEAADKVELYYTELAEKITSSEKWKKIQAAKTQAPVPPQEPEKQGEPAQRSTLDNSLTATTKPQGAKQPQKKETEEDRIARAVAKYKEVKEQGSKKTS